MDSLLAPLEELNAKDITPENISTKIPIPSPEYLQKIQNKPAKTDTKQLTKYQEEYEEFCKWSALPKDLKKPPTAVAFERKYLLPKGYSNYFKSREDFRDKVMSYFWDWMMDLYPDVVHAVYGRAINKSSKDAAIFIELISKKMNLDKPKVNVAPMVLVGVPQEKIDKLFTPKGYEKIVEGNFEK